jgi:putative membrane protein
MLSFVLRGVFAALGFWVATYLVKGLVIDTPATLVFAGLLLGLVNAVVRPIAVILTFPITIVTIGIFLLVINAAMVGLVAWLLPGMSLAGFWSALGTSVIVWLVSLVAHAIVSPMRAQP